MSTDAQPTANESTASGTGTPPNGAVPPGAADPRPDLPTWEEGPDKLPLTLHWREYLANLKWMEEQFRLGTWDPYVGNYIAVANRRLIAHGPDLRALRERVAKEPDVNPARVAITYVAPAPDE